MKDDKVFIRHILDEMNYIIKESKDLKIEDLMKNETLKRALIRSLEIIGEATKNLSKNFREKHSDIEWREMSALRDKLIHKYFGVNWNRIWDVIENFIPKLKKQMEALLKKVEEI